MVKPFRELKEKMSPERRKKIEERAQDVSTKMALHGMHRPPHPGEIIRELCIEPLGLTITRAAEALGVSRKTLSAILNGRVGISPEMALRLSIAFDTSAESWLNQQVQYDLWLARQHEQELKVERLVVV